MYRIVLAKTAEKEYRYLRAHDVAMFSRIRTALHSLADDPYQGKSLKLSLKGKWSCRVGVYRIIYSIGGKALIVYVLDIGHRWEIYR